MKNGGADGGGADGGGAGTGADPGKAPGKASGHVSEKGEVADTAAGAADDKLVHLRPPRPCPTCGKPSARKSYPFCSGRCADVDLNRWLSGQFVVPGRPLEDGDDEDA